MKKNNHFRSKLVCLATFFMLQWCFFSTYLFAQRNTEHHLTPTTPNTCTITGKIIQVNRSHTDDTSSPCYKYPCSAKVKLLRKYNCGSSVSIVANEGDTISVTFAYTLHNTKKLYPGMKSHYPGLKKGSIFTANAEQRLQLGNGGIFVVYGYRLK